MAKPRRLDATVAEAVSLIMNQGWEHVISRKCAESENDQITILMWALPCAWTQLLAGDIDSLREEPVVHGA